MIVFARGEGIWYDAGLVYVATTHDETIHIYDTRNQSLSVLFRASEAPGTPLRERRQRPRLALRRPVRRRGRESPTRSTCA